MKIQLALSLIFISGVMAKNSDQINCDFYNSSGDSFNAIPFGEILPELLVKYGTGKEYLEIGSGPGALAVWLKDRGLEVTCLEPAEKLASAAALKGLQVYPITIQEFTTTQQYDCIVAISSLIHVPKIELPTQIEKIAKLLKPRGRFFVSFIEGNNEGLEDPTHAGKQRYFSKLSESELDQLLSPHFYQLASHKIYNKVMDRTFFLRVYALKDS